MKELQEIQSKLEVPKDLYNKFGNYYYRSAETILKALKPLLKESNCVISLTDEMVELNGRYYVKATATLTNSEGVSIFVNGFAREAESKKGMDEAQITGAASSYARKYALGGLFGIEDANDPDATNKHGKEEEKSEDIDL
jgi:hypothetical protein